MNTIKKAQENELKILQSLAKFSWLTTRQIGQIVWSTSSHNSLQLSKKTLLRMYKSKLIDCSELLPDEKKHPQKSRFKIFGWFLIERGNHQLLNLKPHIKINGYLKNGVREEGSLEIIYSISKKNQYHRFLCNQFLIDRHNKLFKFLSEDSEDAFDLLENDDDDDFLTMSEAEVVEKFGFFNQQMGCVPDAILRDNIRAVSIEIENSSRGFGNHGKKLMWFMNEFAEVLKREDVYERDFSLIHELRNFPAMEVVFVCSCWRSFRNIYRYVHQIAENAEAVEQIASNVHYIVINEKIPTENWIDPFSSIAYISHENGWYYEEKGRQLSRFSDDHKIGLLELRTERNITVKELARDCNVSVSTIYAWNREFEVWKKKVHKPRVL